MGKSTIVKLCGAVCTHRVFRFLGVAANAQQRATKRQSLTTVAVSEKSVMADAHEVGRKDVKEKATDKLDRIQLHGPLAIAVSIVFVTEGDLVVFKCQKALIGDGYAVGIAGQVLENVLWTSKGRLCVNDPIGFIEAGGKRLPGGLLAEVGELAAKE